MRIRVYRLFFCTLLTAASMLPLAASAVPFSNLVIFGDSLADSGNNAAVFDNALGIPGVLRTPTPIPSPSFITDDFPYASGRYSNGPVWVEQFAASLGLSARPSVLGGTNFAYGGARTGPAGSSFPFSLLDQVTMFLTSSGGVASPNALYVIEGGGNDARDALRVVLGGGSPASLISSYASNIATILLRLANAGADEFLLANVPDLGKSPAVQALGAANAAGASALAQAFNNALSLGLASLPANVRSEIHLLDLYTLTDQIVGNPAAFGLTDATSACGFSPACIANPATTFFWDGIHPTSAGHGIIARAAIAAIPEPATTVLIGVGLLMALSARSGRFRRARSSPTRSHR